MPPGLPQGVVIVLLLVAMVLVRVDAPRGSGVAGQLLGALRSRTLPAPTTVAVTHSPAGGGTTCSATGADPTGVRDSTQAIRNAITACETAGGAGPFTVRIPAGTYKLDLADCTREDLQLAGPNVVTLEGAGRMVTRLVEWVGLRDPAPYRCNGSVWIKSLLSLRRDGSVVQGLKLDTYTYDAGSGLIVSASKTTVKSMWVTHGGLQVSPPMFSIKYSGNTGADRSHNCTTGASHYCHSGNVIDDLVLYDEMCDDGVAFAFQHNATITNMKYQGARLALYIDNGVTLNGLTYSPGVQACNKKQGFWLTSPSTNITINNYVTSGGDGLTNLLWSTPARAAGGGGALGTSQNGNTYQSTHVHLNGYRQTGNFANELLVANIIQDFTLGPGTAQPCTFGTDNFLRLLPQVSVASFVITGCVLSQTKISAPAQVSIASLLYVNDSFTMQAPQTYSWTDLSRDQVLVTLSGGSFSNCSLPPTPLRFRTSDTTHVTFARAAGATYPTGWSCR